MSGASDLRATVEDLVRQFAYQTVACGFVGLRGDPVARFWSHVDRSGGPDACWPWLLSKNAQGYGRVEWNGRHTRASRVAYELATGRPLINLGCHTCDNPPCCNPAHIFDGDTQTNALDAVAKGRPWGAKGERNGRAILTEADVVQIRMLDGLTMTAIGLRFGVSRKTVKKIREGDAWRHLP